jgi:cell wall-associated NlpC family hydrolase
MAVAMNATHTGGFTLKGRITTSIALIAALILGMSAAPTYATPSISDKQAEAARVKQQIDSLDTKVEIAAEDYNEASERYAELSQQVDETRAELEKTRGRIDELEGMLNTRAESMYRTGRLSMLEVLLDTKSFEEFAATWDILKDLNSRDADAVAELKVVKAQAERAEADLAAKQSEAKSVKDQMAANKSSIENQLANRKSMLTGLESEIAALERAEAARAAAAAASSSRSSSRVSSGNKTFPPPTRAPRSEVVNIAKRYLGAPYRWGASGPNSFDCSGFTSFVYRQVGVSLPRVSRAQIGAGQRVSRSDLQPGDLVFFGSPIHHVGIYVGGNSYIHSPRTGDVVKISSLTRRDYAGACRP